MDYNAIKRLKERVLECGGEVFFGDISLEEGESYLGNSEKPIVTACPYSETKDVRIRAVKVDEIGNLFIIGESMDGEIIDPLDVYGIYEIDKITDSIITDTHSIWMRVGVTVKGTKKEIEKILSDDEDATDILRRLLKNHKYEIDGETYIPDCVIQSYNEDHHTDFGVDEINFNF